MSTRNYKDYDNKDKWVQEEVAEKKSSASSALGAIVGATVPLIIVGGVLFAGTRWVRCPPNKLMVVYGTGSKPKFVHGGGSYVWPLYQQHRFIDLAPVQIPIDLASEIILGQFRDVIASMDIHEMNTDRAKFSNKVNECVGTELAKYGLELINVNFKDITDDRGIIKAMGEQAAAEVINSAKIDVEAQNKRGEVGVTREIRERTALVARLNKERDIEVHAQNMEREVKLQEQETSKNVRINFEKTQQERLIMEQETKKEIEIQKLLAEQEVSVRELEKEKIIQMNKASMVEEAIVEQQAAERDIQVTAAKLKQETEVKALETQKEIAFAESLTKEETERAILATKRAISIAESQKEESVNRVFIANAQRVAISAANAEATLKENETQATIASANADLAKHQAFVDQEAQISMRRAAAKIEEEDALARKAVALANYERIRAELSASVIVEAEIEKAKRILIAETQKAEGLANVDVRAAELLEVELAAAKAKRAKLQAEAEYIREVVDACGGADGAARYFLVDKVEGLAKHSADAVKNIKFDKVVLWDNGSRGGGKDGQGGPNPAVQFVTDLVTSVAPAGELVKNVLGIDMKDYLGSKPAEAPTKPLTVLEAPKDSHKE